MCSYMEILYDYIYNYVLLYMLEMLTFIISAHPLLTYSAANSTHPVSKRLLTLTCPKQNELSFPPLPFPDLCISVTGDFIFPGV